MIYVCARDTARIAAKLPPHKRLNTQNKLIIKGLQTLNSQKPYLTVAFTSPLVGLWSPPKKNAPFVCIEPWYGRTDSVGYDGMFEDREHMHLLERHETFKAQYEITIHR